MPVEFREQSLFLRSRHLIRQPRRLDDGHHLAPQAFLRVPDRRLDTPHFRMKRTEILGQLDSLAPQTGEVLGLLPDEVVREDVGEPLQRVGIALRCFEVPVARLLLGAHPRGGGHQFVETGQLADDHILPILDGDGAVLLPEALKRLLARLQMPALLRDTLLQPLRRVPGGPGTHVHVPLDVDPGQRVVDVRRKLRIAGGETHGHYPAVPDQANLQSFQESVDHHRFPPRLGAGVRGAPRTQWRLWQRRLHGPA